VTTFEFYRFRFHFRAADPIHFPRGKSGNVVRGAFGAMLRASASREAYARLFEPGTSLGKSPSGLADWPRPLVFRVAHLDGTTIEPGTRFSVDVHVFEMRSPVLATLRAAFAALVSYGIGPGRGRAELHCVEQIALDGQGIEIGRDPAEPSVISLDPFDPPTARVRVRFLTPTELKTAGVTAAKPDFQVLFSRLRDRISTLRALYGAGPLAIDFRSLGENAAAVRTIRTELQWEDIVRRSGRTGQVHPLGGFTGEAEYEGDLAPFLPWLRAGHWVGVGRHTVWGKGDLVVIT